MRKFKILIVLLSSILLACSVSTSSGENDYTEEESLQPIYYTVSFILNNNEIYDEQSVQNGTLVKRPENPTDLENSRFVA